MPVPFSVLILLSLLATLSLNTPSHAQDPPPPRPPSSTTTADLLRPPNSDPYAPPIDWGALPAWQQTSYFGIRAKGQTFIFVVDCSGSMDDNARLLRAKAELLRSLSRMQWPQRFLVIFYNDRPYTMPGLVPQTANPGSIRRLRAWLNRVAAEGETEPRAALRQAVSLRPDAVFLLTDGEYPEGTAQQIDAFNTHRVPIHCIAMGAVPAGGELQRIASDSGGSFAVRD